MTADGNLITTMVEEEQHKAKLTEARFSEILKRAATMTADGNLITKMVEEEQHKAKLTEARFYEILQRAGVEGTVKQFNGEPGDKLIEAAHKEGASMIVTGCRGLGKLRRTFMGSVSDYVVHHSSIPVLVVRHDK